MLILLRIIADLTGNPTGTGRPRQARPPAHRLARRRSDTESAHRQSCASESSCRRAHGLVSLERSAVFKTRLDGGALLNDEVKRVVDWARGHGSHSSSGLLVAVSPGGVFVVGVMNSPPVGWSLSAARSATSPAAVLGSSLVPENPRRVGPELRGPLFGTYAARRGSYRVLYTIDEQHRVVAVKDVEHRSDMYRP
jgi:mRNA interferase RelE/StbE